MALPESILDAIKLSPKYLLPVFLVAVVLLFAPVAALERLGVQSLVTSYRMWIGLIGLASGALLLSHLAFLMGEWGVDRRNMQRLRARGLKYLASLTPGEREIMAHYIALDTRSQKLEYSDGVTKGLEHQGLIYRASTMGSLLEGFAYNIQEFAWEELRRHPELLEPQLSDLKAQLKSMSRRRY